MQILIDESELSALKDEKSRLIEHMIELQNQNDGLNRQMLELENDTIELEQELTDLSKQTETEFNRDILDHLTLPVLLLSEQFEIHFINNAAKRFFSLQTDEAYLKSFRNLLHPKSRLKFQQSASSMAQGERLNYLLTNLSGEKFSIHFSIAEIFNPSAMRQQRFFFTNIITFYPETEANELIALRLEALEQIEEAVVVLDGNLKIKAVNSAFTEMTGFLKNESLGQPFKTLSNDLNSAELNNQIWHAIQSFGYWEGELLDQNKRGQIYPIWLHVRAKWDSYQQTRYYLVNLSDISKIKFERKRVEQLSLYDSVTGLPNRTELVYFIDNLIQRSASIKQCFSLLTLKITTLQEVIKQHGHSKADLFTQQISQRLISVIENHDYLARSSSDEFVIVLTHTPTIQALSHVIKQLHTAFSLSLPLAQQTFFQPIILGVSYYPEHGRETEVLLRKSNAAMLSALSTPTREHNHVIFDESLDLLISEEASIKRFIHQAIDNIETGLEVHYQPIVSLNNSKDLKTFECLIRLKTDAHTLLPHQFLPIAKRHGLMPTLGLAIFEKICQDISQHPQARGYRFSINLSQSQFIQSDLFANLQLICLQYKLSLNQFMFEIKEIDIRAIHTRVRLTLEKFVQQGASILLDDFGTGYAPLTILQTLPVSYLKIDKSFIQSFDGSDTPALIKAIVNMAKALEIKTVCEGIETEKQFALAQTLEADYYQGYWHSIPKPLEEYF